VHVDRLHALIDGLAFHLLVRDNAPVRDDERAGGWARDVVDRELASVTGADGGW
jgi:hypothetical protein